MRPPRLRAPRLPRVRLTRSQAASLLTGTAAFVAQLHQAIPALQAVDGVHLPKALVMWVTAAGVVVPMFSRSLSPANSGVPASNTVPADPGTGTVSTGAGGG